MESNDNKNSNDREENAKRDSILYDLSVIDQEVILKNHQIAKKKWIKIPNKIIDTGKNYIGGIINAIGLFKKFNSGSTTALPLAYQNFLKETQPHQILISEDGSALAISQLDTIQLRFDNDDFHMNQFQFKVPNATEQWQKFSLAFGGQWLALASGAELFLVFPPEAPRRVVLHGVPSISSIAALISRPSAIDPQCEELLLLDYQGMLLRVFISKTLKSEPVALAQKLVLPPYKKEETILNLDNLHFVTTCMDYNHAKKLIAIGGGGELNNNSANASQISLWKVLDAEPFYERVFPPQDENIKPANKGWISSARRAYQLSTQKGQVIVHKVCFSPEGNFLATLDLDGLVVIWDVEKRLRIKRWTSQALYTATNPSAAKANVTKGSGDQSIVRDIAWWDLNKLTVVGHGGWTIVVGPVDGSNELKNLLGSQPEVFAPDTHITRAIDGRFFVSECVKEKIQVAADFDENEGEEADSDEQMEEETKQKGTKKSEKPEEKKDNTKVITKPGSTLGSIIKSTIAAIMPTSDDDQSWPLDKRVKDQFTFRLLSLSNTTPERLFISKIDAEEYGDALTLARIYNLNPDPVYQKRWATSPVTKHSIQDFLSKIKDLNWVLRECKERVPETLAGAKALLLHGLKITTPKSKIVEDTDSDSDDENDKEPPAHDDNQVTRLNPEELDLLHYRLVYLRYLDRLETYSAIITEPEFYSPKHYLHFRTCNLVNAAINFGFEEKFHAIDLLFTYHSTQTLPHRLDILHHIPDTVDPHRYSDLLPSTQSGNEGEWETRKWRAEDWSEHENVLKQIGFEGKVNQVEDVLKLFDRHFKNKASVTLKQVNYEAEYNDEIVRAEIKRWIVEGVLRFPSQDIYAVPFEAVQEMKLLVPLPKGVVAQYPESGESLALWYSAKSLLIEDKTGLVENALGLVKLAIENGVQGLETLRDDLEQLNMLVYECARDVKLKELDKLSPYERISLFLADSTEDTIIFDIQHRVLPYVKILKTTTPGIVLLGNWMVEVSEKGKLSLCTKIFQQSRPVGPEPPGGRIIENHNQLLRLALECMYACPQTGPSAELQMNTIFECLPAPSSEAELEVQDLQDRVDLFEKHLSAMERLTKYNQERPSKFFLEVTKAQSDMITKLLTKIANKGVKSHPALNENQWREILKDLLWLVDNVFTFIKRDTLYALYLQSLLRAGKFKLAREYLALAENTEHIILEVAAEYFNSCTDPYQSEMNSAEDCLRLVTTPSIEVRKELNLIHAVRKLSSLGLKMLPVKIRLEKNRMNLIKKTLNDRPESYMKRSDFNEAAELLGLRTKEDLQMIALLEARAAFKKSDWTNSSKMCKELVDAQYKPIWTVCKKLALTEEFKDLDTRMQLLSFALCHCSKREIESLISYWRALENRQQCQQLGITITDNEAKALLHEIQSSHTLEEQENEVVSDDEELIGDDELYEDETNKRETAQKVKPSSEMNMILANSTQFLHLCLKKLLELDSSDLMRNFAHDYSVPDRLRFHPFYSVNNAGYVAGDDLYSKFKAPSNDSLVFAFKQAVFKLSTITFSAQKSRAKATLDLAERALHSDIQLFFAYLMSLERAETAKSLFDSLIAHNGDNARASEFSTKLACYYYCLELLTHKSYIQDKLGFKLYNYSPNAAIEFVEHHMQKVESKMSKETIGAASAMKTAAENEALANELLIHIKYYQDQLRDFSKVRELKSLSVDIDVTKFGMDEVYRKDMISKMTHSDSLDQFRTAVSLATRYHQPEPYQIIIEHLMWLLEHAKEFETLQYHMKEYEHTILEQPAQLLEDLKAIEAKVNGTNANSLTYLYFLMRETQLTLKAKTKAHNDQEIARLDKIMELLGKWTKIIPKPDFKALQQSPESAAETLTRVISEQNVFLIAKLLQNVNDLFNPPLSLSLSWMFKTLIHPLIFKKGLSHEELQKRTAAAAKYFERLDLVDLKKVVEDATIHDPAVDMPLDIKLLIVGDAIQFVTQKEDKGDPNTPNKSKGRNRKKHADPGTLSYGSLTVHFERIHDHLLTVQSATSLLNGEHVNLLNGVDVNYYINSIWKAFNSYTKLNETLIEMISNGIHLRAVHQLVVLLQQEQEWNDFPKKNKTGAEVDLTQLILDLHALLRVSIDKCLRPLLSLPKDATVSLDLDTYLNKKQHGHHGHWPISEQDLDWAVFYFDKILTTIDVALKLSVDNEDERPVEDEHRKEVLAFIRDKIVLNESAEINVNAKILVLKLLKNHAGLYGHSKEDKALFNRDMSASETLSSEFIVGTVFGKEIKPEKLETIQAKRELFNELVQSLKHDDDKHFAQQIEQLISLVLLWSQAPDKDPSAADELSAMWLAVLEPLTAKAAMHEKIVDAVWRDRIDQYVKKEALVEFVGRHKPSLATAVLSTGLAAQIALTHLVAAPHARVIALAMRRGLVANIAAKSELWSRARLVLSAIVAGDVSKMRRAKTDGELWRDAESLKDLTCVIEDVKHNPHDAALSAQALVIQLIEGHLYLHAAVFMFVDMGEEIDPHFHTPELGLRLLPQYLEAKVNQQVIDRNLRDDHDQHVVISWRECLIRCSKALVQLNNTLA